MHFTRRNQDGLKSMALEPTGSTSWMQDAIAFGACHESQGEIVAVAVFQNFRGNEADFHFAMIGGKRIGAETVKAMLTLAFSPRMFDLSRLWGHIAASNATAQVAAIKAGASFEYRIRAGTEGDDDVIVMSMLRAGPQRPLPAKTTETHGQGGENGRQRTET